MKVKFFFLVFFVFLLTGCKDFSVLSPVSKNETPKPSPKTTLKPKAVPSTDTPSVVPNSEKSASQGSLVQPGSSREALVTGIIDGDTIEIAGGIKVRYLGMSAPESSQSGKKEECYGYQAQKKNQQLVDGKVIRLEKDFSEANGEGQLLRYVWLGDTLINETLVRQGYAKTSFQRPDFKYQERLLQAQTEAEENQAGFWGSCQYFGQPRKKCGCPSDYQ